MNLNRLTENYLKTGVEMERDASLCSKLPDSIILHAFSYLNNNELCEVALVCRRWKRIARDRTLWTKAKFQWSSKDNLQAFLGLRAGRQIRRLHFHKCLLSPEIVVKVLRACVNVKELSLRYCYIYDQTKNIRMAIFKKLVTLDTRGVGGNTNFVVSLMHYIPNLENLAFDNNLGELWTHRVFTKTPKLRILDCSRSLSFTDKDIEVLAWKCQALECLSLMKCFDVEGESLPLLLHQCQSLKSLSLAYLHVDDEQLSLCDWANSSLIELDLSHCRRVRLNGFTRILTGMPKLTYLNLSHSGDCKYLITGRTVELFCRLKALKVLDLNGMNSTKDSEDKLCDIVTELPQLESLTTGTIITTVLRLERCLSRVPNLKRFGITSPEDELLETDIKVEHVLGGLAKHCRQNLEALGLYGFHDGRSVSNEDAFVELVKCCQKLRTIYFVSGNRKQLMAIASEVTSKLKRNVRFVRPVPLSPVLQHVTPPPTFAFHGVVYGKNSDNINY